MRVAVRFAAGRLGIPQVERMNNGQRKMFSVTGRIYRCGLVLLPGYLLNRLFASGR